MAIFGCVADDFTGASDAASFLQKAGASVLLCNGIPENKKIQDNTIQAIVIALKSRTQKTEEAQKDTLEAVKWLEKQGVQQFYFKYCSTFDSTSDGNIGPVADMLMEYLHAEYTLLCPALPINGRTVFHGNIYVNNTLLQESPMKNHPLTPMKDSNIKRLMEAQSKYNCLELWKEQDREDKRELDNYIAAHKPASDHYYLIPDYQDDEDGRKIAKMFGGLKLLTGGSGLLEYLPERWNTSEKKVISPATDGSAIVFAGSCSKMTLEQIEYYKKTGRLFCKIDPFQLISKPEKVIDDLWDYIVQHEREDILIYSSDTAENVRNVQELGKKEIAELLEKSIAELARRAVESGKKRIIVAGGETSGAVTRELGFSSYKISKSIAPGVPVLVPEQNDQIRLVLKSGNFGDKFFFENALKQTMEA